MWKTHLIAAVVGAAVVVVTPAAAEAPATSWQPYHATDVTYEPGDVCSFGLSSTVVFDKEFVRTPQRYADGSPRRQVFSGPLVVRVTNLASGRSVRRDLSAYATASYGRDGTTTITSYGPIGVGFHSGDGLPPGYYVLSGVHRITIAPDGTKQVVRDHGREENVCDAVR